MLEQNWKGYFASIKDFGVNPSKYKGLPKPPRFKNIERNKNEIMFTNLAIRFQNGILKLSLSKAIQKLFEVKSLIDWNRLQQARFNYNKV